MAAGDITWFSQAKVDLGNKIHALGSGGDTLNMGFITSTTTPTETTAGPHFGGTGTTDLSTNQTSGGNVPAGGITLTTQVFELNGANAKFDFADITIAANASNPSAARWGVIYNSTDANKRGIAFLDLGADVDMTSGFTFTVNASGAATLS